SPLRTAGDTGWRPRRPRHAGISTRVIGSVTSSESSTAGDLRVARFFCLTWRATPRACSTLEAAVKERSNADWLRDLRTSGDEQAAAVSDLRAYLLRAARFALHRRAGHRGRAAAADLDQMAEDCAQESLLAILARLDSFRGESRFTTWAYSFAV